jgi:hypothetical protein
MCLLVEKLLVTCCGGYSPGLRDFRFRITERSNTKPSGSVSVHATFFNKQVRYHALKRMQEVLLRNHARYCASAEIAITPFHLSGMARYALRRVSAQIATQWIMRLLKNYHDTTIYRGEASLIDYILCTQGAFSAVSSWRGSRGTCSHGQSTD